MTQFTNGINLNITGDPQGLEDGDIWSLTAGTRVFVRVDAANTETIAYLSDLTGGSITGALWDANTIIKADTDDTPIALTVGPSTLVGRAAAGNIEALSPTDVRTVLNVEDGATGDQTAAEIKTAYESNADTNAYTDAAVTKLAGIEAGAQVNPTDAEVLTALTNNADTNILTDAEQAKLAGIEAGATGDQTPAEIKAAYEGIANTNAFTDAEQTKLAGVEAGAAADQNAAEVPFTPAGTIAATNTQAAIEELDGDVAANTAAIAAQQSITGQNLGTVATNAALLALADVDGSAAIEDGDFAILNTDDGGREAGIYVRAAGAWPAVPAYTFPDSVTAATAASAGIVELATNAETTTGTDATRAVTPAALAAQGYTRGHAETIGNGTDTTYTITHNLNSEDVVGATLRNIASGALEVPDFVVTGVNTITVTFATPPASNSYRVTLSVI